MLTTAIATFVTFLVLFVVVAVVVRVETVKGRRILLSFARTTLDNQLHRFHLWLSGVWNHFVRYVVQLGWYYSIHSLLRTLLKVLVSVYTYIEDIFERNREKTKLLRRERKQKQQTHFSKIADHKAEVALSKEEQEALMTRKLEQDH
ncbi:MAG: hypothetical protein RL538_466 [Candidatus Parcubacteria bacterium]|jgi:hypothetical protein